MIYRIKRTLLSAQQLDAFNSLRCLSYFSAERARLSRLLILMGLSMLAGILQAWPLAVLVDSIAAPGARQGWIHRMFTTWMPQGGLGQMIGLSATALVLGVSQQLLIMRQKLLHARVNYGAVLRMRQELFRWVQAMHLEFHCSRPLGDTVFRLTTDTFGCQAVLGVFIGVGFAVIRIGVLLSLLVPRSFALTAIALLVVPPLIWANFRFGRTLQQRTAEAKRADSAYLSFVHRAMAAVGLTQAYGREDEEYGRFGSAAKDCVGSWLGINKEEASYSLAVGVILASGGALILGYGGYLVQQQNLTPGDLMIFISYLGMMYDPLCQLTGAQFNLQSGLASAKRVFEVLDQAPRVCDMSRAKHLPVAPRRLTLEHVSFEYSAGTPVLKDICAEIPHGKVIGFVGASGVGKSTLLSLLPRFYDPSAGRILLDGQDIRSIHLKDLRKHIALALQDSVLLPTNIWENIAYGRPSASEAEIRSAAMLAGAAGFIERLPDGYRTKLSESGANLSGGQRQRIAIARALLTRTPILVLDEPTSAQDGRHEAQLQRAIAQLRGQCTVILVSHRINTIRACDLIYVLAEGRIKEAGNHDELLQLGGIYATLAGLPQNANGEVTVSGSSKAEVACVS